MIELPELRPYQVANVAAIEEALKRRRCIIDCMPAGGGKSTVAKYILGRKSMRAIGEGQSGNAVFAVHRRGLVDNAIDTFNREPKLPHGVAMSGRNTNWAFRTQVGSIDTMLSWYIDGEYTNDHTYDLMVFDEIHAHHSKFQKFVDAHQKKRVELGLKLGYVIGLSATPMAKGLANLYAEIVKGPTVQWLIDEGFLVPFQYFQARKLGKLDALKGQGDGFTDASLEIAFEGLAGDLVDDWLEKGKGRPTIGFFSRLSHAEDACAMLNSKGIRARYVDGKTPDENRRSLFRGLNEGEYDYLCNVGVVDRGTDIPNVSCIQLVTAINSIARLIQVLGRASRNPGNGKTDAIVIDHGGSIQRLNTFFEDDINWMLEAEKTKDLHHDGKPMIPCPRCRMMYRGGKCRNCGYEPTAKERKAAGLVFERGELVEIKKKAKGKNQTCEQIFINALFMAGQSGRTYKQAIGIAQSKARLQGTKFRVPSIVEVGGKTIRSVPYGHADGNRKVSALFDGMFGGKQ